MDKSYSNTTCQICISSGAKQPSFLTATKEELVKRPPIPKDLEDELRIVARILRKRVEEDWEKELLQAPLKRTIVEEDNKKDG